jgi:polyisoprenoid-binding protein YceI
MRLPSVRSVTAGLALTLAGACYAEPVSYSIDPNHTWTIWEARHMGTSTYRGRFDRKEGSVTIDRAAKTGHAEITIDLTSVDTGVAALDKHLKSKDFLDVEQFGQARFVGDKFTFDGDRVAAVEGSLTLHGQTQPVTLKASGFNCYVNPQLKREVCGGDFETTLQRAQWGIDYGLPFVSDKIRLLIEIEAIKQQ